MGRRVFYAARPLDVVLGFLQLTLFGGLVYLMVYAHAGFVIAKCLMLAFAGLATMLRRDRVVAEPRWRTLEVTRWWFLVPYRRLRFRFDELQAIRWLSSGRGVELVAELPDGQLCVLARASVPDAAQSAEVRQFFGLPPNPEHDAPIPPAPLKRAPRVHSGLAFCLILVTLVAAGLYGMTVVYQ